MVLPVTVRLRTLSPSPASLRMPRSKHWRMVLPVTAEVNVPLPRASTETPLAWVEQDNADPEVPMLLFRILPIMLELAAEVPMPTKMALEMAPLMVLPARS